MDNIQNFDSYICTTFSLRPLGLYIYIYLNRVSVAVTGGITGPPVPGGYKYGNLAHQVGGVSNETVKYGREFCGTSTQE
jgi:hypothetical protein